MKLLEIKTETCEIKNVLDGINCRLDVAEEKMCELENSRLCKKKKTE